MQSLHVSKYVKVISSGPTSKIPKNRSFDVLVGHDSPAEAKLQFFIIQAKVLTPYLEKYQSDKPVVIFMAEDLQMILKTAMKKFVKKSM